MIIRLQDELPFVAIVLTYRGQEIEFENVLLDTGSAGTIFPTDRLSQVGLRYEADDMVHRVRGVGGAEFVFSKRVDQLSVGTLGVNDFEIEVGALDYGFEIEGILGMDFLTEVGAKIDLANLVIEQA
jgi:predicted aspartyl protease